jgi:hypothetical protein
MDITIADQRILLFDNQITFEDAEHKAWEKKMSVFDTFSQVGSFLSRPKDEDFEVVYKELRYQPFWHVNAKAKYVYDRNSEYQIATGGPEVKSVTFESKEFEVINGHMHASVTEHCIQEEQDEVFIDGVTGKNNPELKKYLSLSPRQAKGDLGKEVSKDAILVPPQTRVSAIMREALSKMIKGIQADKILEETIEVPCVDLYYHPIYAFQYKWRSKNKEAILEMDGLTGEIRSGNRVFREYIGKVLDQNFLFDLGADAAGLLIPGGSIAVKVAKKYIDNRKN